MPYASELMNPEPTVVSPDMSARDLAVLLLEQRLDGVCVVVDGELRGVVTTMDLVRREAHMASQPYVTLLDRMVPGGRRRKESALNRAVGGTVGELMSSPPKVARYDDSLEEIAALMVEDHITVVPVTHDSRLVGVIYKADIIRATLVESVESRASSTDNEVESDPPTELR